MLLFYNIWIKIIVDNRIEIFSVGRLKCNVVKYKLKTIINGCIPQLRGKIVDYLSLTRVSTKIKRNILSVRQNPVLDCFYNCSTNFLIKQFSQL